MADVHTLAMIQKRIESVESEGFGEVNIKIKNGAVYRVINSVDTYVDQFAEAARYALGEKRRQYEETQRLDKKGK